VNGAAAGLAPLAKLADLMQQQEAIDHEREGDAQDRRVVGHLVEVPDPLNDLGNEADAQKRVIGSAQARRHILVKPMRGAGNLDQHKFPPKDGAGAV